MVFWSGGLEGLRLASFAVEEGLGAFFFAAGGLANRKLHSGLIGSGQHLLHLNFIYGHPFFDQHMVAGGGT